MIRVLTQLLVLVLTIGSGIVPATAGEPVEPAGLPAQESPEVTTAAQPEPVDNPRVTSTHHQCFQQSRFPPRRAKKKPASSSSSHASPQDRSG